MKQTKERYIFLDIIKVIAIFMVVFYHFNYTPFDILGNNSLKSYALYFMQGAFCSCVTLFFMVNGAIMLNKDYDLKKHINKIVKTTILVFIWGTIQLLLFIPLKGDEYTLKEFIEALVTLKQGRINPLWFLQTLICIYIFFPVIKALYDTASKKVLYYFTIIISIFTFGMVTLKQTLYVLSTINQRFYTVYYYSNRAIQLFDPFKGFYAYSIVFFILGGLLFDYLRKDKKILNLKIIIAAYVISMTALFSYGVIMSKHNNALESIVWGGYVTIMNLVMSSCIFVLCFKIENIIRKHNKINKLIHIIGNNTLGVYLLHSLIGNVFRKYYVALSFYQNIFINTIYVIFLTAISLGVTLILKKIPLIKELFKI